MDEERTNRLDPVVTNPDHYRPVFENERVRVLEYRDVPGTVTTPHDHPDSVMVTLSAFRRRLVADGRERDVELVPGQALWLGAQRHHGENIGATPTHVLLIELKADAVAVDDPVAPLGPATGQ
jgi:quercetin dioxygenase-like cupin family protein